MSEQTVTAFAETAIARAKVRRAGRSAGLPEYNRTNPHCFSCARRRAKKWRRRREEPRTAAAADYLDVYYRFPLNDEAKDSGAENSRAAVRARRSFSGRAAANANGARRSFLCGQTLARRQHGISRDCCRNYRAWIISAPTCASCSAKCNGRQARAIVANWR